MILIANEKTIEVLKKLQVTYTFLRQETIENYIFSEGKDGISYLESCPGAKTEVSYVELAKQDMWKTDKTWNCFRYRREELHFHEEPAMAYRKRENGIEKAQDEKVEDMAVLLSKTRQLDTSDLYLLIPGKLKQDKTLGKDYWDKLDHVPNEVFDIFSENIEYCIKSEYYSNFADTLERKCLGEVILEIEEDRVEKRSFRQSALVEIVRHETGLCILEIIVYNCSVGGNKLLNYHCASELIYEYEGRRYTLQELMDLWHIRPYGKMRSMVFAYGDVSDEAVINALVNEEYPMGRVGGDYARIVREDNIAQYDTAEVFVSSVTMLERCKSLDNASELILDYRIAYHTIEIFFVELLLFQDASIDKIYLDVKKEQGMQEKETDMEEALERYEQIGFDMGKAMGFSDYEQFVFPTTRISARKVALRFGIEQMYEKYETNRQLLETMIQSNKRQMEFKQDKIKNSFLLLISGVSLLGTLGESLYNICESMESGIAGYGLAVIIIGAGFFLYQLAMYLFKNKIKKVKKGDK